MAHMDVSPSNLILHKPFASIAEVPLPSLVAYQARCWWASLTRTPQPPPPLPSLPDGVCSELDLHRRAGLPPGMHLLHGGCASVNAAIPAPQRLQQMDPFFAIKHNVYVVA